MKCNNGIPSFHFFYDVFRCSSSYTSAPHLSRFINAFACFCYIEKWGHGKYVAHSGLIVAPKFRGKGLAKKIKTEIFNLSKKKYPDSKVFGITTSKTVMRINFELGYRPVSFSELTDDPEFWKGCRTCVNYDILTRTDKKMCLCTGMLNDKKK
jgi:hypothetical protein